ncbi:hypothetical protein [Pyrinomonas sp.]
MDAVSWVTKGGHKVKEAVWELGIDANGLSHWKRKLLEQGKAAFAGKGS